MIFHVKTIHMKCKDLFSQKKKKKKPENFVCCKYGWRSKGNVKLKSTNTVFQVTVNYLMTTNDHLT